MQQWQKELGKKFMKRAQEQPAQPYDGEIKPLMSPYESPEVPNNSVFHPDNIGPVTVIQLSRIYDAIMALLAIVDADKATRMADAHAQGITLMAPPAFTDDEDVLDSDA